MPMSTVQKAAATPRNLLARAAIVARKGYYAEAEKLLQEAHAAGECSAVEALDLQARIFAQQGMLLRAEACWTEALRHDPGNGSYVAAIAALRRMHDPLRVTRSGVAVIAIAVVIGVGIWISSIVYERITRHQEDAAAKIVRLEQALEELGSRQDEAFRTSRIRSEAVENENRRFQSDTATALAARPTDATLQEQFSRLSEATQTALDRAVTESKLQHDALTTELVRSRSELSAAVRSSNEQQTRLIGILTERLDKSDAAIARLSIQSQGMTAELKSQIDDTTADIREELASLRGQIVAFIWSFWPFPANRYLGI